MVVYVQNRIPLKAAGEGVGGGGGGVLDVPFYHNSTGLYLFLILICSVIFNGFLIRNILELMI